MSPKFLEEGLSPTLHSVPESTTDGEAIQKLTNNIHLEKEDVDMDLSMNGVKSGGHYFGNSHRFVNIFYSLLLTE